MSRFLRKLVNKSLSGLGYQLNKVGVASDSFSFPVEFEKKDRDIASYVLSNNITMVSLQRLIATIQACKFVIQNDIEGDFVECGVWRGGNSIAAKMVFEAYRCDKKVILFDTFAGMTEPTDNDKTVIDNALAIEKYLVAQTNTHNEWCYASLNDVKNNFQNAGVSLDAVSFVKGDVLETLSDSRNLPNKISVLRLDTDWYESTKKEMEVLYGLVSFNGVLVIDDYGHWDGARKAIEEYFVNNKNVKRPLLQYTDYTGRMGIKI